MENENKNEIIDALIERMEKTGATIDGLKNAVAAIEKRKMDLEDKKIKVVRKTISSEAENGIVIAAYTDKNGKLADGVFYAKGSSLVALSMMTNALLNMLDDCGVSLEDYIYSLRHISEKWIQLNPDERKKKK